MELEQAGIVAGPPQSNSKSNAKYLLIVVLCFAVIIFFSFRILQKKVEAEKQEY